MAESHCRTQAGLGGWSAGEGTAEGWRAEGRTEQGELVGRGQRGAAHLHPTEPGDQVEVVMCFTEKLLHRSRGTATRRTAEGECEVLCSGGHEGE